MPSGPPTHAVQQKTTTQEKLDLELVFRLVLSFVSFTTIIHVIMIEKMDGAGKAKLDCSRSPSDFPSFCLKINVVVIVV